MLPMNDRISTKAYEMNINQSSLDQKEIVSKYVSNQKLNLKGHFILEYLKKNKGTITFISLSYLLTSLILVSYGVVFYFLAYKFIFERYRKYTSFWKNHWRSLFCCRIYRDLN